MEFFYRVMRARYNILMDGKEPCGGQWNFDQENRKNRRKITPILIHWSMRQMLLLEVMAQVSEIFADHFGDLEPFYFCCNA